MNMKNRFALLSVTAALVFLASCATTDEGTQSPTAQLASADNASARVATGDNEDLAAHLMATGWVRVLEDEPDAATAAEDTAAAKEAKDFIRAYGRNVGSPGYPAQDWYARNTSRNRAIRVTFLLRVGGSHPNRWTKTMSLEPGEEQYVANKYDGRTTTALTIRGARYL